MELIKSNWGVGDNKLSLSMPISKVDTEKRLVSGFATLDNSDRQDDIVTMEASRDAFAKWAGNIREMHQPIAAGRLVEFREDSFYDTDTQKFYEGIYVTVYVSKGAQSTWEKVLDGTLTGFSIGGDIIESSMEFVKDAGSKGKQIRFIKAYELNELSLVDVPANQLANVFSVQKSLEGSTLLKGLMSEVEISNVFWCEHDKIGKSAGEATQNCYVCDSEMKNVGWFEKGQDDSAGIEEVLSKFMGHEGAKTSDNETITENSEGGVKKMSDEVDNTTEEVVAEVEADEIEKSAEATEEVVPEQDFSKMLGDLTATVTETLEKNQTDVRDFVATVDVKVDDVAKALAEQAERFEKSLDEIGQRLDSIKSEREGVEKRLEALETKTAIKKSGEAEEVEPEKMQKSLWAGAILS